jgi:hypothetical protein
VFTQTWPAPGDPAGAGLGEAFLPKRPLSGPLALALGAGVGLATETGDAAGEGLFLARVFFGLPAGVVLAAGLAAGDGLVVAAFFVRFFGVAEAAALGLGVGVCE